MSSEWQQLYDEAAERFEAFYLELLTWNEIIAWADEKIMQFDKVPDELFDVSLSLTRPREGMCCLGSLAKKSKGNTILPFLKLHWHKKYQAGEIGPIALTRQIWSLRGNPISYDSEDYLKICLFDHLSDEATGVYWVTDEQKRVSLQQLDKELREWLSQ